LHAVCSLFRVLRSKRKHFQRRTNKRTFYPISQFFSLPEKHTEIHTHNNHVSAVGRRFPEDHRWIEGERGQGQGGQRSVPVQNHQGRQGGQGVE